MDIVKDSEQYVLASAESKKTRERLEKLYAKLLELLAMPSPQRAVDKAFSRGTVITHNPKLHHASRLEHKEGVFFVGELNDGYVHSLSVHAKPENASDVDFEFVGNAAYAKVYAIAGELLRSDALHSFAINRVESSLLHYIADAARGVIARRKSQPSPSSIPPMLPTTAHYNGDEPHVFTLLQASAMPPRYANARYLHARSEGFGVKTAETTFGTTSSKTQNSTSLPNGARAIAIVHATYRRPQSQEDVLLGVVKYRGLAGALPSLHPTLATDVKKLFFALSNRGESTSSSESERARNRAILDATLRKYAKQLATSVAAIIRRATDSAIKRLLGANSDVGAKITKDDLAVVRLIRYKQLDERQVLICAERISASLLAKCAKYDTEGKFAATEHHFNLMRHAIVDALKEARFND